MTKPKKATKRRGDQSASKVVKVVLEPITISRITIGKYSITAQSDGSYWIVREPGEGMQTSKEKLEQLVDEFYCREF